MEEKIIQYIKNDKELQKHNGGILKKNCARINRKKIYYDIEGIFGSGVKDPGEGLKNA